MRFCSMFLNFSKKSKIEKNFDYLYLNVESDFKYLRNTNDKLLKNILCFRELFNFFKFFRKTL